MATKQRKQRCAPRGPHLFISLLFIFIKNLLHARHHAWSEDTVVKKTNTNPLMQFTVQYRMQTLITTPSNKWAIAN